MTDNDTDDETLLEFPCDFPIKAMGKAADDFDSHVVQIVRKHTDDLAEGSVTTRPSTNGNYLSVTVVVHATSKRQLDDIYLDLTASDRIIMVF